MKNLSLTLHLLLLVLIFACSHRPSELSVDGHISREPQSVFTITKIEDHSPRNLQVLAKSNQSLTLKYRLIKPINAGAAKSPASATVELGTISGSQFISDERGFITLTFTPSAQPGTARVTISAGKVQVSTKIEVLPPVDYSQLISSEHSQIEASKTRAYADGEDIIEFKLNLKDKNQQSISLNSQMHKF